MESFESYLKKKSDKKETKKSIYETSFSEYLKKSKLINEKEDEYLKNEESEESETEETDSEETETEDKDQEKESDDSEEDEAEDYEKDEDEEAEGSSCPISTQDQSVNIENRQKAIDEFGYGPEKIEEANDDFWKEKKTKFMVKTVELAKEKKCGNCAAFSLKKNIVSCLDKGIDKKIDENDTWDADTENRGFCEFLDFKCHAQRTCNSWVEGGPLKD